MSASSTFSIHGSGYFGKGLGTTLMFSGLSHDGAGELSTSYGYYGQLTFTPAASKMTLAGSFGSSFLKDDGDNFKTENSLTDQQLAAALLQEGLTMPEWRRIAERQVIIQNVQSREIMSKTNLTEAEQKSYYDQHPELFMKPVTVTIREIFVAVPTELSAWRITLGDVDVASANTKNRFQGQDVNFDGKLNGAFGQPPEGAAQAAAENEEWLRERVQSTVSGLLGLAGVQADPMTEHPGPIALVGSGEFLDAMAPIDAELLRAPAERRLRASRGSRSLSRAKSVSHIAASSG